MQLETVGRVSMSYVRFQIGWQIDNIDSTEWTFLGTDTTTNAKILGDERDFRLGGNFDTKATTSNNWARFLAFLSTFLRIYD